MKRLLSFNRHLLINKNKKLLCFRSHFCLFVFILGIKYAFSYVTWVFVADRSWCGWSKSKRWLRMLVGLLSKMQPHKDMLRKSFRLPFFLFFTLYCSCMLVNICHIYKIIMLKKHRCFSERWSWFGHHCIIVADIFCSILDMIIHYSVVGYTWMPFRI